MAAEEEFSGNEMVPMWKRPPNERFLFSEDFLLHGTPSRLVGLSWPEENEMLQYLCTFLQHMGTRNGVAQLCINTACVYLRRMYCYLDLKSFSKTLVAASCFFLACKVEEQPRKLEHVVQAKLRVHAKLSNGADIKPREADVVQGMEEVKVMENVTLKILGFDLTIDHPHTYVVKGCQIFKASKDFAQTAYFLATNSLHLTNMCVMYKPQSIACVCIYLASKWARYQIPKSTENKEWWHYIDPDLTMERIQALSKGLLDALQNAPHKYKRTQLIRQGSGIPEEDKKKRREDDKNKPGPSGTQRALPAPTTEGIKLHREDDDDTEINRRHADEGAATVSSGPSTAATTAAPRVKEEDRKRRVPEEAPAGHLETDRKRQRVEDVGAAAMRGGPHPGEYQVHPAQAHHRSQMPDTARPAARPGHSSQKPEYRQTSGASHEQLMDPAVPRQPAASPVPVRSETAIKQEHVVKQEYSVKAEQVKQEVGVRPETVAKQEPPSVRPGVGLRQTVIHPSQSMPNLAAERPKISLAAYHQRVNERPAPLTPVKIKMDGRTGKVDMQENPYGSPSQSPTAVAASGSKTSPQKHHKREGSSTSISDKVSLKEPMVALTDLKDTSGPVYNMYASAQRRNSTDSERVRRNSRSETGTPHDPDNDKSRNHKRHHSDRKHDQSLHRRKTPSSSEGEVASPNPAPLKLHLKLDKGLKMKIINKAPEAAASPLSMGPAAGEQGLKMKLPVTGHHPSSSSYHRHGHGHHDSGKEDGRSHKRKHSSHGHSFQAPQLQSGSGKSSHHSSHPQAPSASGNGFVSDKQPYQSRGKGSSSTSSTAAPPFHPPPLKSQSSGFSFNDSLAVPSTLPDIIFEPDTPTDINGGLGMPTTPTVDNMNFVNAHMQHLYSQNKSQARQVPQHGFGMMGHQSHYAQQHHHPMPMYPPPPPPSSLNPPLPPPLPDNPPPPPPPPPQ